jgi:hypothetical protein
VLDGIDALLADDDPAEGADPDSPKREEDREPLL